MGYIEELDDFALELMKQARKMDETGKGLDIETKTKVFTEAVRWAAVKNKIDPDLINDRKGNALNELKRQLRGGDSGGDAYGGAVPATIPPPDSADIASPDPTNPEGFLAAS